ncbi:nuclear distribution protein PAC1 [Lophiotrema nucula]|uniref:Nuclear distribution protein PAC1 n=1 Tax=Lophiotrema nucula TaxID=690887 RepID=A0A6A5YEI8_9PLEO|nr:nuclear distribution protein PAC1 [Lophiotrema nucula]
MSGLLTPRQAEELHKSIIAYLQVSNLPSSAATLQEELGVSHSLDEATCQKYSNLLERKWTTVVRLQKRIMELEPMVAALQAELDSVSSNPKRNRDPTNWLPTPPARHVLRSHRGSVTCVAFHPVFYCTIKIWYWELGDQERTLKGHTRAVLDVDFGSQRKGPLLASCSSDLTIKLWDPDNNYSNIRTLSGHDHSVSAVRFLPTSENLLVSASRDTTMRIWDISTGYCVKTIRGQCDWIRDVSPSFDGKWLVACGDNATALIWDVSTGELKATLLGHDNKIQCCTFAPPSSYTHLAALAGLKKPPPVNSSAEFIATGSRDKTIKLRDSRGTLIRTIVGHDNWVNGLVFHAGGKYLISVADDKTVRCWDLSQEARLVRTIEGAHEHFVSCIRWAPRIIDDIPEDTTEITSEVSKKKNPDKSRIRCVIATGSVDSYVRVFLG